jgi:predicted ATPase
MNKTGPLRSLTVRNLLSFGEKAETLELRNLNILIGPNGSGKSNLIEVLGLLQNAPKELATAISNGGPIEEWLWKGARGPTASIEAIVSPLSGTMPLRYRLSFASDRSSRFQITDECIENESPVPPEQRPYFYFAYQSGRPRKPIVRVHRYPNRRTRWREVLLK